MSTIHLSSYNTVCWRPGKSGWVDVAGTLPLFATTQQQPSSSALDGAPAPLTLACIKQPKQELAVWLSWKGCRDFHKPPKEFTKVLHICTEDTHLGIFYTRHHGEDVSFALAERVANSVDRLVGPPQTFAAELKALLSDVGPTGQKTQSFRAAAGGARFAVRGATLRKTARGYVVGAVVSVAEGDSSRNSGRLFGVVGDLTSNVWRKWRMDGVGAGSPAQPPCIFIPANGTDVRFVRCDVEPPPLHALNAAADATAPSAALALSAFRRVSTADAAAAESPAGKSSAGSPSPSTERVGCAVFRECVVPTATTNPVTERCFHSLSFLLEEQEVSLCSCLAVVEEKSSPVYTVIVPGQRVSYVVHVSYSAGGADLVASAAAVPDMRQPVGVCCLRLPTLPQRPHGTSLSVVLCADMKVHACEHFGSSATAVALYINNLRASTMAFPFMPQGKKAAKQLLAAAATAATANTTRLIAIDNGTRLLCTNGVLGVFFRVSAAVLTAAAPTLPGPPAEIMLAGGQSSGQEEEGAAALRRCLAQVDALALRCSRRDLPDAVFKEVLPFLRWVGTSQQEVMLVQRLYGRLLQLAGPILQSEWSYLWALTSVLQRTLSQRSADHALCYTDSFFLQLAETYRQGDFASEAGAAAVQAAVHAGVSAEATRVLTAAPAQLSAEVQYVLDGLASGVSPVALAEEVARRMVQTGTLANGTCVVSAPEEKAACVHVMGALLLAACLDMRVTVCAEEGGEVRVCAQRHPSEDTEALNTTCVSVAPYAFADQGEFELALTLAADLLCVSTADASFRPDVALLSLAIGTRQHCLDAFVQLFAPVLQAAVEAVMPLAHSTAWLEACTAALSRSYEAVAAALWSEERSTATSLTTTLAYVLYAPQHAFNVGLFRTLTHTTTEEFCTTALVGCVYHQTEKLVAAANNYAAAVATRLLSKNDAARQAGEQAVLVGRQRLHDTLAQTLELWSHVDSLSPYRVQDVAASYRMSARSSVAGAAAAASGNAVAQGTVVSRTLVQSFRLLCLVQLCCDVEAAAQTAGDDRHEGLQQCVRSVSLLYFVKEAPVPLDWFQHLFVEAVQKAAAAQPSHAPYLLRLLQLSNVRQTGSAALKRDFYRVVDQLERTAGDPAATGAALSDDVKEELRRAVAAAESAVTSLTLQEEVVDVPRNMKEGTALSAQTSTVYFIFSATREASLPRWTASHEMPERRFLFSQEWTEVLWTVERLPEELRRVCETPLTRVAQLSVTATSPTVDVEPTAPSLSAVMALPLFEQLCRLRPPVRMHAVSPHHLVPVKSGADTVQRQGRAAGDAAVPVPVARDSGAATPEKSQAPAEERHLPAAPPVAPAAAPAVAAVPLPPAATAPRSPASLICVEGVSSPALLPPQQQQQHQQPSPPPPPPVTAASVVSPSSAAASAATPAAVAPPQQPPLYAAADVAWWDAIGLPASTSRAAPPPALKTPPPHGPPQHKESPKDASAASAAAAAAAAQTATTNEENGESSDTATSYTTSTSNYADPMETLRDYARPPKGERRHRESMRAGSVALDGSSDSNSSSVHPQQRHRAHRISPRRTPTHQKEESNKKKKCRCCSRDVLHRSRSAWGVQRDSLEASYALRWCDGPVETTVSPLRRLQPPTSRAVETARPTLLSFASRLQPPEEPSRPFAHSARSATPRAAAGADRSTEPVALLRLPSGAGSAKEPTRVRLYTLHGERVTASDGGDIVPLQQTNLPSRGVLSGRPAPLTVPAVPPSSVFVSPPPLLQLPQHATKEGGGAEQPSLAALGAAAASAELTGAATQMYAQVARDPVGPAPAAVDVATLHPSSGASVPAELPSAAATPAPPPATASVPGLPVPFPPSVPVLPPSQLSDFRRYTDDLLARHAAPPPSLAEAAPSSPAPAPTARVEEERTAAECAGVARLVQQQDDFIRKAEALLQTRQAENEGFYRRVVESIRSLTTASQQLRGLTPVEQSQLVRDTVKQRNELMSLNHQLLDMQLAAARVTGELPHPATATAAAAAGRQVFPPTSTPISPPSLSVPTAVASAVSAAPQRTSVGVAWAAPPPPAPSLTSVPTQTTSVPTPGMQATLSDLQKLNVELMGVNASAAAMDKAIQETRDVIQRYERNKTAEALAAEGTALTAALRLRTAAMEQRLAELPRPTPHAAATTAPAIDAAVVGATPPPRKWTSQSFSSVDMASTSSALLDRRGTIPHEEERTTAVARAAEPPLRPSPSSAFTVSTTAAASPSSRTRSDVPQQQQQPPPAAAPAAVFHSGHITQLSEAEAAAAPAGSSSSPPPIAQSAPAAAAAGASPPSTPSPIFTSVSSTPLAEVANAAAPPSQPPLLWASPDATRDVQCSPSISFERQPSHLAAGSSPAVSAPVRQRHPYHHDERAASPPRRPQEARVFAHPSDLRTLFVQAGGGGVPRAGAFTPPNNAVRARTTAGAAAVAKSVSHHRPTVNRPSNDKDRYAMYRTESKPVKRSAAVPSSCLPVSYARGGLNAGSIDAPHTPVHHHRASVGDAYAERQRDRRLSSIAQRMEQLEHDLFG